MTNQPKDAIRLTNKTARALREQAKAQRTQQRQYNHHRIHAEHGNARRSRKISRCSEGVELLKGTHASGGSFRCLIGNAGGDD